jgi:hypothetical protein
MNMKGELIWLAPMSEKPEKGSGLNPRVKQDANISPPDSEYRYKFRPGLCVGAENES